MIHVNLGSNVTINNLAIGNGQVINGTFINGEQIRQGKKIDEWKSENASKVESITINSTIADIDISVSNSQNVETHLYGQTNVDGDVKFDFRVVSKQLQVTVKATGICYNGNLKLDVTIPKKLFESIVAESASGDITLHEGL